MICRALKPLYNRRTGETWSINDELELSPSHARYHERLGNVEVVSVNADESTEKTPLDVFVQPKGGTQSRLSAMMAQQQPQAHRQTQPVDEMFHVPSEARHG